MKPFFALIIAAVVLSTSGCMSDPTRLMVESCRHLLGQDDVSGTRRFVTAAEERIAALNEPPNKLTAFIRDFQDPDAMIHKPALEQCLWQLKARQS